LANASPGLDDMEPRLGARAAAAGAWDGPAASRDLSAGAARTGLLVLGMHRAGTSLLARVLNLVGAAMPRTLIGASTNNEAGYWESRPVQRLDDRLLLAAGTGWDGWLPIAPGWFDTLEALGFVEEARMLLRSEWGEEPLLALKDPRACRLAPFWIKAFQASGIRPLAVLTLRDPVEVAASLEARNGLAPEQGHLVWLRHALDAEAATRGLPRAFSTYSGLLADWRGEAARIGERLGLSWPVPPGEVPEALAPIRADLRHQTPEPGGDAPFPSTPVRDAQAVLERFAAQGEDAEGRARLDALRAELDAAGRLAGPAVARARREADLARAAEARVAKLGAENADLRDRVSRSQERALTQGSLAAERLRALEEARRDLAASSRARGEVAAELRGALEASMADARAASQRGDEFAARLREREMELAARTAELVRTTDLLLASEARGLRPRARLRDLREAAAAAARPVGARVGARLGALAGRAGGPTPRELRRRMDELRRTGEFDAEWYLRANLDVALSGMDPLRHYVLHGEREGRPPNAGAPGGPASGGLASGGLASGGPASGGLSAAGPGSEPPEPAGAPEPAKPPEPAG
jgi:hypothetical protein